MDKFTPTRCEDCGTLCLEPGPHFAPCGVYCLVASLTPRNGKVVPEALEAQRSKKLHNQSNRNCPAGCFDATKNGRLVTLYRIHPHASVNQLYFDNKEDADLAALGQGEYGENCLVIEVDAIRFQDGRYRLLGNGVAVKNINSQAAREEALRKLSPFERKLLGVKE